MPFIFRKLLKLRNTLIRRQRHESDEIEEITEEKWIADFSKPKHTRFDIKSESSYDANLRKNLFYSGYSMALGLKKTGCIAWTEAPERRYRDLAISGSIRIDARGGYGAGGILFRMVDNETYYSFLISSKSYFRLDAVRNGSPLPLVGWTELPLSKGAALAPDQTVDFSIIVYGSHIIVLLKGRWAAEIDDSSILEGTIGFAAASYESGDPTYRVIRESENVFYSAEVFLESLNLDSRIDEVSSLYEKWRESPEIDSRARLNLAETFAAMEQYSTAMIQLRKAWDTSGHRRTQGEYLFAGRLARQLGLLAEAENLISGCFQADINSHEGKEALVEMAKILNAGERFKELKDFCVESIKIKPNDPVLLNFQGHAYWNLGENKKAAEAYSAAFELDKKNGIIAKNAANVYDVMGRKKEAIKKYIEAGKAFLQTGNYNDLGLLVPKLLSFGEDYWEARSLAGKWAFAVEDWKMAKEEFAMAEKLRKAKRPKPRKDGAQVFLEALLLVMAGNRKDALPLLEEAAALEKDYALFHFRLAENIFLLKDDSDDPQMLKEMEIALALSQKENLKENLDLDTEENLDEEKSAAKENEGIFGWINNFAAQVALKKGNLDAAARHLEKARSVLGDLPAVRINQGVLFYLQGSLDKALEVLSADKKDDPEGIMANCAGNLLVRSRRFEEADERYRQALSCQSDNVEYLCNRATCLMEINLYGEADNLLSRAHLKAPNPALLEMISYVAAKKGEYPRAEQACHSALEIDPNHAPSLISLGWIFIAQNKNTEAIEVLQRLDKMILNNNSAKNRGELRSHLEALFYMTIECASCPRNWKVPRECKPAPAIRLQAMPPDELPAGSCLDCGKTYCIGCAKEHLDSSGRFVCPTCGRRLKLINEGLKKIVHDWAVKDGLINKNSN
jgi:tetratricopeptide (TPR) repeat protein